MIAHRAARPPQAGSVGSLRDPVTKVPSGTGPPDPDPCSHASLWCRPATPRGRCRMPYGAPGLADTGSDDRPHAWTRVPTAAAAGTPGGPCRRRGRMRAWRVGPDGRGGLRPRPRIRHRRGRPERRIGRSRLRRPAADRRRHDELGERGRPRHRRPAGAARRLRQSPPRQGLGSRRDRRLLRPAGAARPAVRGRRRTWRRPSTARSSTRYRTGRPPRTSSSTAWRTGSSRSTCRSPDPTARSSPPTRSTRTRRSSSRTSPPRGATCSSSPARSRSSSRRC